MNSITLRGICAASVFFGLALALLPEGKERRTASLCVTAALVLMFASLFKSFSWDAYALSLAELRDAAETITDSAAAESIRLNRLVIERECEEYIMDKARELSLVPVSVKVRAAWKAEGVWVPESAVITLEKDGVGRQRLSSLIEAQLGVAGENQEWYFEEDP